MVGLIELLVSRRPQGRRPGLVLCRLGESFRDRCWEAYITSTNGWLLDLFQIRMTFCPPTGVVAAAPSRPALGGRGRGLPLTATEMV